MNDVLIWLLTTVHVVVALFLIVLVLMQKSSEQGVGAAFGGGVTETAFGAGTTSALVRITIWCAGIMLGTTLILAILHSHRDIKQASSVTQKVLQSTPVPMAPNASQAPMLPGQPTAPANGGTLTPAPGVTLTPSSAGTTTPSAPATPNVEQTQPAAPAPSKP
jgi:preprotein translocase subunit SecG